MRMEDFRWALLKVLRDWRLRRPKQVRQTLPPAYTSSILRYVRINACKQAAPHTIECAKWSQTDPCPPDPAIPSYPLDMDEREGPFPLTAGYVCDQCKHPCLTNGVLIGKLGLTMENEDFTDRTWRRYINAEQPMPIDQFRRAVANGFAEGWLGLWQALSAWRHIDQLEAARNGILAVFRRAAERKAFQQHQKFDVSEAEMERELGKQWRLLDREATRVIDQRLKAGNLPPELRQFMEKTLFNDKGTK